MGKVSAKRILVDASVLAALIAIMVYAVARSVLLGYAGYSGLDKVFSLLLLSGEFFILLHSAAYLMNVSRAYSGNKLKSSIHQTAHEALVTEPSVAVLVAARHEPREVLEQTFSALSALDYVNKEIYLLDDSSEQKYIEEAEEVARTYGARIFRREERHGAKAGIINDCLKSLENDYVAIFDADQCPLPQFLKRVVPILEKDRQLAFVQTPQFYNNPGESRVARAAAFQQAVFYEYICEGKSSQDAMICCGTNIVFRKRALMEVGGFDETTVTEDFATSFKLHQRGWRSLYYEHTNVFGMAPSDLGSYFKQQYRWAHGTMTVIRKSLKELLTRPFSLSFRQWWEYLISGSYYAVGIVFFILMMFPVLYIVLEIPTFFARPEIYALTFLPYIILTMTIFYSVLKARNYTIKDLLLGQLLGSMAFSVYAKAIPTALAGVRSSFGVTGKDNRVSIPYLRLWPQLSLFFVNFCAFVWGINRFVYEREPAILLNSFWVLYHCLILSSVFYFNAPPPGYICKKIRKGVSFDCKIVSRNLSSEKGISHKPAVCFEGYIKTKADKGEVLICKLGKRSGPRAVFEARILQIENKGKAKGYRAKIGVFTITEKDRELLEKEILI